MYINGEKKFLKRYTFRERYILRLQPLGFTIYFIRKPTNFFPDFLNLCAKGTNAAKKHLDLATYSTYSDAYLGPYQTSTMGLFAKIAYNFRQLLKSQILIIEIMLL